MKSIIFLPDAEEEMYEAARYYESKASGLGMSALIEKRKRDIEKNYPSKQFAKKLRRLADCIEKDNRFRMQVAGERIVIPPAAIINIEHERSSSEEEVEFQIKWKLNQ